MWSLAPLQTVSLIESSFQESLLTCFPQEVRDLAGELHPACQVEPVSRKTRVELPKLTYFPEEQGKPKAPFRPEGIGYKNGNFRNFGIRIQIVYGFGSIPTSDLARAFPHHPSAASPV